MSPEQAPHPTLSPREIACLVPPLPAGEGRGEGLSRIASLDSLRGIAALAVVFHHLWLLGAWTPSSPWQWRVLRYTPLNIVVEGRQPVILFFVLSGFVLAHALIRSPMPYGRYLVRRFTRIYLPFAAAILLSAAGYALLDPGDPRPFSDWFGGLWRGGWSLPRLLHHLAMPGTGRDDFDPVIWSLVQELRISALIPALLWGARRGFVPLLLASLALQLAVPETRPFWGAGATGSLLTTGYFVCFFVLGIGLALRADALPRWPRGVMPVAALALLCGAAGANDLAYGAGSVLLIASVLGTSGRGSWLGAPPLLWLGRISYSLYLVHVPVFLILIYLLLPPAAFLPLLLPAALFGAWGFNRLMERPSQRLGAALTRTPSSSPGSTRRSRATDAVLPGSRPPSGSGRWPHQARP